MQSMGSRQNSYTKDEIRFLFDNYLTMTNEQLAEAIGRSASSVSKKMSETGLSIARRKAQT